MLRPSPPLLPLLGSVYLLAWNTWVRSLHMDNRSTASLRHLNATLEFHPFSKPRPLRADWTYTHSLRLFKEDLFCYPQIWRSQLRLLHSYSMTLDFVTTAWPPFRLLWMMTPWPRSTTWTKVCQFKVPAQLILALCDCTPLYVQLWCYTTTRPPGLMT